MSTDWEDEPEDWTTDAEVSTWFQELGNPGSKAMEAAVEAYKRSLRTRIEEAVSKVAYRIEREAWDTDAFLAVNAVRAAVLAVLEES